MKKPKITDTHIIEYDLKLAVLRIAIILLIIFSLFFSYYYFYSSDNKVDLNFNNLNNNSIENNQNNVKNSPEIKKVSNNQIFDNSTKAKDIRGMFYSLKDEIFVQGDFKLIIEDDANYVEFTDFQITEKNYEIFLATDMNGKAKIKFGSLNTNLEIQKYKLPDNINLDEFEYLIISPVDSNQVFVFGRFSSRYVQDDED